MRVIIAAVSALAIGMSANAASAQLNFIDKFTKDLTNLFSDDESRVCANTAELLARIAGADYEDANWARLGGAATCKIAEAALEYERQRALEQEKALNAKIANAANGEA